MLAVFIVFSMTQPALPSKLPSEIETKTIPKIKRALAIECLMSVQDAMNEIDRRMDEEYKDDSSELPEHLSFCMIKLERESWRVAQMFENYYIDKDPLPKRVRSLDLAAFDPRETRALQQKLDRDRRAEDVETEVGRTIALDGVESSQGCSELVTGERKASSSA